MEFHAITDKGVTHVCSVERGPADQSPLQMISQYELARLQRAEAELARLQRAEAELARLQRAEAELAFLREGLAALLHASPLG